MALPDDRTILARIETIARQHLRWQGEVHPDEPLVEALKLDSLRMLTLIVEIENHFRICLDEPHELQSKQPGQFDPTQPAPIVQSSIVTANDLVRAVRRKLEQSAANTG